MLHFGYHTHTLNLSHSGRNKFIVIHISTTIRRIEVIFMPNWPVRTEAEDEKCVHGTAPSLLAEYNYYEWTNGHCVLLFIMVYVCKHL